MIEHYIRGFEEELREIRHQIHENPELGLQEFKTSALVAEKLRQWGYEVEQGLATTGVVATLKVGDGEKSIGLRADWMRCRFMKIVASPGPVNILV